MKRSLSFLVLITATTVLHAQTWWGLPNGIRQNLHGVWGASADRVYAVGDSGAFYLSIDGGATWGPRSSGTTRGLRAVRFAPDRLTGYVCGEMGEIRKTANGGTSWSAVSTGSGTLNDLSFTSATSVWAVGDRRIGYGFIFNPITAAVRFPAAVNGKDLHGVWFFDDTSGYAVGDKGLIIGTADLGATWNLVPTSTMKRLRKIASYRYLFSLAVGDSGTIVREGVLGGWNLMPSGTMRNLNAVYVADAQRVYAVGDSGTILASRDGGLTWRREATTTTVNLHAVHGVDADHVWAVGDNGVIIFRDATMATKGLKAEVPIALYPNPATNRLTVTAGEPVRSVIVYNMLGEKVLEDNKAGESISLNVESLRPAVYRVEVRTATGVQVRKFRKE